MVGVGACCLGVWATRKNLSDRKKTRQQVWREHLGRSHLTECSSVAVAYYPPSRAMSFSCRPPGCGQTFSLAVHLGKHKKGCRAVLSDKNDRAAERARRMQDLTATARFPAGAYPMSSMAIRNNNPADGDIADEEPPASPGGGNNNNDGGGGDHAAGWDAAGALLRGFRRQLRNGGRAAGRASACHHALAYVLSAQLLAAGTDRDSVSSASPGLPDGTVARRRWGRRRHRA